MILVAILAATKSSSGSFLPLLLIVIFGAAYFFFIRPRQQQQRKARQSSREVEVGDEVVTVGGVHGTVQSVGDDHVVIATGQLPDASPTADGSPTQLTFVKAAIARKVEPVVAAEETTPPAVEGHDEGDAASGEDDAKS